MENYKFFNYTSEFYDEMINPEAVIKNKTEFYKKIITTDIKTAADIGCGTGNDSIALALNGLNVIGFDPASEMIIKAKANAEKYDLKILFSVNPVEKIPAKFFGKFDLLVSMGNSMANVSPDNIEKAITNIYNLLKSGGIFLMQILSYRAIIKYNRRLINITRSENNFYIRFYDILENSLNFNILSFNSDKLSSGKIITTVLYPYSQKFLSKAIRDAGFKKIHYYSDMDFNKYNERKSKDLIIKAIK